MCKTVDLVSLRVPGILCWKGCLGEDPEGFAHRMQAPECMKEDSGQALKN